MRNPFGAINRLHDALGPRRDPAVTLGLQIGLVADGLTPVALPGATTPVGMTTLLGSGNDGAGIVMMRLGSLQALQGLGAGGYIPPPLAP